MENNLKTNIHLYLYYLAIYLNLTQHCKSTILQYKFKKKKYSLQSVANVIGYANSHSSAVVSILLYGARLVLNACSEKIMLIALRKLSFLCISKLVLLLGPPPHILCSD